MTTLCIFATPYFWTISWKRNAVTAAIDERRSTRRPWLLDRESHAVAGDEALHASVAQDDFSSVVDADHHFH